MILEILKYIGIAVGVISFGIVILGICFAYFLSNPDNYR